jgi:predicted alpha/beta-hydrolase family hydrolase
VTVESRFQTEGIYGILHQPDHPTGEAMALTHGAGSNCQSPLLARLARDFAEAGVLVLRYDLPFRRQRLKGPPFPAGAARDRAGIVLAVNALRQLAGGQVFAGGHSYGGRQTAMAASEQPGMADGLLLLSYPLHPPAKPEQMRTAFFPDLRTPALFVHGTNDPFGSLEELSTAVKLIDAPIELIPVEKAGHDLKAATEIGGELLSRLRKLAQAR